MAKPVRLGQNFLVNQNVVKKMAALFSPQPGPILEIGPGKGILTEHLIDLADGHKLVLVEIDKTLAGQLKNKYVGHSNIELIEADIIEINLTERYPAGRINLIGNIPYYISKDLIDWIIDGYSLIDRGMLLLQKDFTDKLSAVRQSKQTNSQGIMFQYLYKITKQFLVSPGSFQPAPRVLSQVITFEKIREIQIDKIHDFYKFLKICFQFRRKTLYNNLNLKFNQPRLNDFFNRNRLDSKIRAEHMLPGSFITLYNFLNGFENQKQIEN